MFYYLYEIRNNLNGKIYVGVHKTRDLNDGYMGSGKVINAAIKKHGIENFTKVILETFENAKAMYARETEIVTDEFLARDDVYNLRRGGHGGFDYINKNGLDYKGFSSKSEHNRFISPMKTDYGEELRKKAVIAAHTPQAKQKRRETRISNVDRLKERMRLMQEAALSDESRKKRKETMSRNRHQQGERNSQFGKMWITNDVINRKVNQDSSIPPGWRKGRIIKR